MYDIFSRVRDFENLKSSFKSSLLPDFKIMIVSWEQIYSFFFGKYHIIQKIGAWISRKALFSIMADYFCLQIIWILNLDFEGMR